MFSYISSYWKPVNADRSVKKDFAYSEKSIEQIRVYQRFFNLIQMFIVGGVALAYLSSMIGLVAGTIFAFMAIANEFVDNENITNSNVKDDLSADKVDKKVQIDNALKKGPWLFSLSLVLVVSVLIQTTLRMSATVMNAIISFGFYRPGHYNSSSFWWPMFALFAGLSSGISDVLISFISHLKYCHKVLFSKVKPAGYTRKK